MILKRAARDEQKGTDLERVSADNGFVKLLILEADVITIAAAGPKRE